MDWSGSGEDEVVCWRSGAFELSAETDAFWFMGAIISANPAWAQPLSDATVIDNDQTSYGAGSGGVPATAPAVRPP